MLNRKVDLRRPRNLGLGALIIDEFALAWICVKELVIFIRSEAAGADGLSGCGGRIIGSMEFVGLIA